MALSKTYIELQTHIADDLGDRSDLLQSLLSTNTNSPIKRAVQSAIAKWERTPFYFNESYDTAFFTTVAGQETYTSSDTTKISTLADITQLHITIGGTRQRLIRRNWQEIDEISDNPSARGQPTDYAYAAEQIRLYSIPDGAYVIAALYTKRFTALSADSDTNVWTQDAYDLIRCEAQLTMALGILKDPELAQRMKVAIYGDPMHPRDRGYLGALKAEGSRRGRGRIRVSQF